MFNHGVTNVAPAAVDQHDVSDDKDDQLFQNHPDLIDPIWERKVAELDKAARRQLRRQRGSQRRSRPTRRGLLRPGPLLLAVVVVLGGLLLAKHPWYTSPRFPTAATTNPFAPTATPTQQAVAPLELSQPFTNTPAAGWSDGAAGIVPPVAKPVGHYSAGQVGAAYGQVRQILVAAHLDPRVLVEHDTSGYLARFAPDTQASLRKVLSNPATPDDGGAITLLAKGFQLLSVPVKVNGSMSVSVGAHGYLTVHTNYVFAYPFAPADPSQITESAQIVAVLHVAEDFDVVGAQGPAAGRGVYQDSVQAYYASMACTPSKHGLLAPAYSEPDLNVPNGQDNQDQYYAPAHALTIPDTCH